MTGKRQHTWNWLQGDRGKALAIVSTIILLISFAFFLYGVNEHNKTIDLLISKTEEDINHTVSQIRNRSFHYYEQRLQTFIQVNPDVVKAFVERDRERLYELVRSNFKILQRENKYFGILHFHLPDGHSFLRAHAPEHWGDDLISIRPSLAIIHERQEAITGFEVGRHGGFFRTFIPVFSQERYMGAVEFGLNMHQAVEIMENMLHLQATSYIAAEEWSKADYFNTFPMVRRGGFELNSHGNPLYEKLPADLRLNEELHRQIEIEGKYYIIHTHQVFKNFNNNNVGGLIIFQDVTQLIKNKQYFLLKAILFTIVLLLVGFTALHLSFNRLMGAMEKAAQEWTAAMDAETDAVYILSPDRHLIQANSSFYKMVGITSEKATGLHIEKIVHPQGEAVPCPVCQAQEDMCDSHIILETDHPDNPSGVPLEITVTIVRDSEGSPLSILMRLHDLSEQRAVENNLRRSKEEWERTFDAVSDLVTIQNMDMRIIRANKAAEELFQVARGGLVGKYCYEVFRGQEIPCQDCPMAGNSILNGDHPPIIRHDNLQKIFHISFSPLFTAEGEMEYLVHIARDITVQQRLEEELLQSHKMEAVGTMAGGIAHDFNNILGAIVGFSEFVRDELAEDSPSRDDIGQVLQAAGRAKELVKQILTFSRKSEHQLQPLEPYYIVKEVLKMLHSTLPSTVIIEQELDREAGMIEADPTKIHQILVNLCTNGFQAMEGEKGVLRVSLTRQEVEHGTMQQGESTSGTYVVLEVSDTGQGMNKETRDQIFNPFFSTKEVGKGTGLGLSVLHGIVKDYKGYVEVESVPGNGSIFRVYLPAIEESKADSVARIEPAEQKQRGGKEEILVVDDDPLLVRVNGRTLSNIGYSVTETTSSQEALEKIRREPQRFDLLVTDQTMPQLTGVELAAEAMKITPEISVILCTGHSSVVSRKDALTMGICRYVCKPVQGTELIDAVREVLDERKNSIG